MKRLLIRALALAVMAGAAGMFLMTFKIAYNLAAHGAYLPTGLAAFSCLIALITINYMLEVFWSESNKAKEQAKQIEEMKLTLFQSFVALEGTLKYLEAVKIELEKKA